MDKDLKMLVLCALLHDIGKFAQRASRPYSKEMESEYLTNYKGKSGHWHTVYTDYFVEKDLPLPGEMQEYRSKIARVASAHHRPDEGSLLEMAVSIADRLSSGMDRVPEEDNESRLGFRESRLLSIFDEIELENHQFKSPGSAFHKLVPLESGDERIFPAIGSPQGPPQEYVQLFNQFLPELNKIDTGLIFQFYIDGLISLLERYTWCIPSSAYKTLPDVSLFDHAFSTASIAQALYIYHSQNGSVPAWGDEKGKFILMGGDLSGIQDYIFGISRNSGRGVSKVFRARSFYLQALTRSVLIEIQNRLDLSCVCRLIDTGGKFILLLPATDATKSKLNVLDEEIQLWFRRKFKGRLTLNLSWSTEIGQQDFHLKNFQTSVDAVNKSIEESKLRKLHKTFAIEGPLIAEDYDENEEGNCVLCNVNAADRQASVKYEADEGLSIPICPDCCDQITYLGKRLPGTDFLIYGTREKIPLFGDVCLSLSQTAPASLNGVLHVESLVDDGNFSRIRLARHLPRLTEDELRDETWYALYSREEVDQPLEDGQPKTFNMIAQKSKTGKQGKLVGRALLGFLKADVDNLGFIFSLGFGDRISAARFTSVSRMLNLFFADYLVELVRKKFPDIYVVFAGGDDLFLIGPWWQTIRFAILLRKQLSLFCCGNPDITLSAGILIAKPRLPMRKAAEEVAEILERAKKVADADRTKNSVGILGDTLSWIELEELMDLGEMFNSAVQEKGRTNFSMAFLYRLMDYHRMYREFIHEKKIRFGRYLALAHYDIGRNIQSDKFDNTAELEMLHRIFSVGAKERPELARLNIPLFYAINMNRD
jgi:CRISPR-associated protein Csm1